MSQPRTASSVDGAGVDLGSKAAASPLPPPLASPPSSLHPPSLPPRRSAITTPARARCALARCALCARSLRAARGAREAPSAVGGASSQPPRGVCCLLLMNSPLAIHKTNNPPLVCYQTTGGLLSDQRGFVFRRLKTNLLLGLLSDHRGVCYQTTGGLFSAG